MAAAKNSTFADEDCDVVVVVVDGQRYGLPVRSIVELHRMVATVPLPGAPPIVEGVINVRGSVVPVLDVRSRLELPGRPAAATDHLVLVLADEVVVGVRVDRVIDLVRVPAVDRAVKPVTTGIEGVVTVEDGLLLVHDVAAFLLPEEAADLRDALLRHTGEHPA